MKKILLTKMMFLLCALIAGSTSVWAVDVTLSISGYASANSWTNGTAYSSVVINSDLTATCATGGNNGKYYTTNTSWRHYQGDNGAVTITTTSGTLNSVTFVYTKSNSGVLRYNSSDVNSGTPCSVSGQTSATFTVANTSTATNGNVQITSIVVNYTPAGVAPSCSTPTFSPAAGTYIDAKNVTITCETEDATLYYTTNGDEPTTSSNTISSGSSISVSSNSTIKVLAKKDGYNDATASAEYRFPATTYNSIADLVAAAPSEAILNLTNAQVLGAGNKDMYVKDASEGIDFYNLGLTYSAGQKLNGKVAVTGYTVYNGMPEITTIGENQLVATSGSLDAPIVLASASAATLDSYKWKYVTVTGSATGTREIDGLAIYTNLLSFETFISGVDNVTATGLLIPYKKSGSIVPELLPTRLVYNITLSKDLVAYCSTNKLDYRGTGLKVYKAKVEGNVAVLTEVENAIVTKEKGIILSGTTGQTYNVPVTTEGATSISGSELLGVTTETEIAYQTGTSPNYKYNYILQSGAFYKATGATLRAGKAYLSTTYDVTSAGAPSLQIVFDGAFTGINEVKAKNSDNDYYNLSGQRVAQPTKGLYIVNGKKVIIK